MSNRFYLAVFLASLYSYSFAHADQANAFPEVSLSYDYASKVLVDKRYDCKAVRGTVQQVDGIGFVDCLSKDGKDIVRYSVAPHQTKPPRVEQVSRKPMVITPSTALATQDDMVNRFALRILREYRYECLRVVKVTTQEDNSLVAICTSEYGRQPIAYQLIETPGAHMNTRVVPVK